MNLVLSMTVYEARVSTDDADFAVEFIANSVPEAYLKLSHMGIQQVDVVDLFIAPTEEELHDHQRRYPHPVCKVW